MSANRRTPPADPDFDRMPASRARLRDFDPVDHQRLVVNPFLAVFLAILWWLAARWLLLRGPFPPMAVATVVFLVFLPRAIQYHCLDCGRTGSYGSRSGHACSAVLTRWEEGRRSRRLVPCVGAQLVLWAYLIGSATLLISVFGRP